MGEIFRGYLSGNGIRQASVNGEIAPDSTEEGCLIGRFGWSGPGVAVGQRFMLALPDGRQYYIEVERSISGSPLVVWFRATQK